MYAFAIAILRREHGRLSVALRDYSCARRARVAILAAIEEIEMAIDALEEA